MKRTPIPGFFVLPSAAALVAIAALTTAPFSTGCAGQTPAQIISGVEAGINDAVIAINTIEGGVNAYFIVHPNATLEAKIDSAITDVTSALGVVNSALAGATSISDGDVQSALTAFNQAYQSLIALVAQIGIQSTGAGVTSAVRVSGVLYVPSPRLLSLIKNPVAVVAPVAVPVAPAVPVVAPVAPPVAPAVVPSAATVAPVVPVAPVAPAKKPK